MRRILVCSGVLGGGTAIVFALAALTATLFPNGTVVNQAWNGGWMERGMEGGGWAVDPVPMPMPMPGDLDRTIVEPGVIVEDGGFEAFPGDTVGGGPDTVTAEPAVP